MSTAVAPSPSTFATLLRLSKFASYDPAIGQVYTSVGGHAHRGDWGLKRPISLRGRGPKATLQAIDTRYQQTEWKHARKDAEWVMKWNEMGSRPNVTVLSTWSRRTQGYRTDTPPAWHMDSDFAQKKATWSDEGMSAREHALGIELAEALSREGMVPDIALMTEPQFKNFLRRVRELRSEFPDFLKEQKNAPEPQSNASLSRRAHPSHERTDAFSMLFLRFLAKKEIASRLHSTPIRPLPHPVAGLSYSRLPEMQNILLTAPLKGRRLHITPNTRDQRHGINVGVGGWVGTEEMAPQRGKEPPSTSMTDYGKYRELRKNTDAGKSIFRTYASTLLHAPQTVGRAPDNLSEMSLRMEFVSWEGANVYRSNPYRPGSREYVADDGKRSTPAPKPAPTDASNPRHSMTNPPPPKPKAVKKTDQISPILDKLKHMISNNKVDPDEPLYP